MRRLIDWLRSKFKSPVFIWTHGGRRFDLRNPDAAAVSIADIAWSLATTRRWTGHARPAYSVAQHSVYASRLVPREYALEALLHDAAEAYTGDIASPLKSLLGRRFRRLERAAAKAISDALGVYVVNLPRAVHAIDAALMVAEAEQLMGIPRAERKTWLRGESAFVTFPIEPWIEERAEVEFLATFVRLAAERGIDPWATVEMPWRVTN